MIGSLEKRLFLSETKILPKVMEYHIPAISNQFYSKENIPSVKKKLSDIDMKYGAYIRHTSQITNVPEQIIKSVIFVESAGDTSIINKTSGAIGLMQIMENSATDFLIMENKRGRFSDREKSLLKRLFGDRYEQIMSLKRLGEKKIVTKADLLNPEINIFLGSIFLGILIDENTKLGNLRLDIVLYKYNKGYFTKPSGSIEQLVSSSNKETSDYIVKVLGKNGTIQLLIS